MSLPVDFNGESNCRTRGSVRRVLLTRTVISESARATEERLGKLLGIDPADVREYVLAVLEDRLWRAGQRPERRTGFTFKRGSHGGTWTRDPEGTDVLPVGVQPPP